MIFQLDIESLFIIITLILTVGMVYSIQRLQNKIPLIGSVVSKLSYLNHRLENKLPVSEEDVEKQNITYASNSMFWTDFEHPFMLIRIKYFFKCLIYRKYANIYLRIYLPQLIVFHLALVLVAVWVILEQG